MLLRGSLRYAVAEGINIQNTSGSEFNFLVLVSSCLAMIVSIRQYETDGRYSQLRGRVSAPSSILPTLRQSGESVNGNPRWRTFGMLVREDSSEK